MKPLTELNKAKFTTIIKTFESKLISTISKLEVRVKTLEDENTNLTNKVREFNKVRDVDVTTKNAFTEKRNEKNGPLIIQQKLNITEFKHPKLQYNICIKELKSKNT